jgi:hypothetical protein
MTIQDTSPSPAGSGGRDNKGRFGLGNKAGTGNPYAKRVEQLRSAMMATVTEQDIAEVITKMLELAKGGDMVAAKKLLLLTLGKPMEADLLERIERKLLNREVAA